MLPGCLLLLLTAPALPAAPADPLVQERTWENTIEVTASGSASRRGGELRLRALLSQTAELADQAVTDFLQARTRTDAALRDLGFPGLNLKWGGIELSYAGGPQGPEAAQMAMMFGMETSESGATCSEEVTLVFTPAEEAEQASRQVAAAIDTMAELGLGLAGSGATNPYQMLAVVQGVEAPEDDPPVSAKLESVARDAVELAAQTKAMRAATGSAGRLAQLSGRELGQVLRIRSSPVRETWQGIGGGVELSLELTVTFALR